MTGYSLCMLISATYRVHDLRQKEHKTELLCLTIVAESPDVVPTSVTWDKCSSSAATA